MSSSCQLFNAEMLYDIRVLLSVQSSTAQLQPLSELNEPL